MVREETNVAETHHHLHAHAHTRARAHAFPNVLNVLVKETEIHYLMQSPQRLSVIPVLHQPYDTGQHREVFSASYPYCLGPA